MSGRTIYLLRFLILVVLLLPWACAPLDPQDAAVDDTLSTPPLHEPPAAPAASATREEEENTPPEPEATVSQEIKELASLGNWEEGSPHAMTAADAVTYDFPVTINKQVEFYLDFFQHEQRTTFRRWLERSGRYLPMIQDQLREAGMPLDLAYLPMIESGYSLTAYSRARAVGPWQFIRSTGRNYGLVINNYLDERRNPVKSTSAAIAFLADLYDEFGSWELAVAGYNAGAGTIRKAIRKHETDNFWQLAKGRYLRLETKRYVPKLIAAIMIAKEPEKYGFTDLRYEEPLEFETAHVPRWTALKAVAVACDAEYEEILNLNRELRRSITPPSHVTYPIKVPVGKKAQLAENLPKVRAMVSTEYKTHVVKRGETVTGICRSYNLNKTTLLKANNLRSAKLAPGSRLRIPYQTTTYALIEGGGNTPAGPAEASAKNLVLHTIRPGETISVIAKRYKVPVHIIAAWNDIKDVHRIRAGQQLALYLKDAGGQGLAAAAPAPAEKTPARAAPTTAAANRTATEPEPSGIVQVRTSSKRPADETRLTYYKVRGGDTLWTIAKKFQTTPQKIRRWNQLDSDLIHPGLRLLLKLSDIDA